MHEKKDLSTDIDMIIYSYIFGINIAIYKYVNDVTDIEYIHSLIYDENNLNNPLMMLAFTIPGESNIISNKENKSLINEKLAKFNLIYPKKRF